MRKKCLGSECYAYDLEIKSHTGTYFETPAHLFRDNESTDEVSLDRLVLPGVCVNVAGDHKCIERSDLEKACRKIEPNSALLVNTGEYTDRCFSGDAAQWMVEKKVALMGSNTERSDTGFVNPTGFFIDLFKAGTPIIANLRNLDKLPGAGFTLIVLPLRISGICTVPCRAAAIIDKL